MSAARSIIFNIVGKDSASPAFLSASRSAEAAAGRLERTTARIAKSGAAMQAAGMKMSKAITLPVIAAAAVSADQAIKFQKSMTLIETAADESAKKTAAISKGIKQVAVETGTSLTDLSAGIYTVAKAGAQKWSAVDQLKVLKAAAQGAKAEGVDLGTAVGALTTIMQGYGMKASDAVKAENMLIRGSGLAKTTMQEFAGSLANVVPLAASLKISFPQIAGAIDTMTQHGETADRTTQNLSNLITNLAGQSHQSSSMMQQLGINVVSLQQHLGKRGLTGTLEVVENALAKSSKGGRIVVGAFKESQTATAALAIELAKMPPGLRKISQQFETGKLGYQDYRKEVRGLGGDQYEMGMQFISSMGKAKGFSDQLKSGDPTVRTAASTLQKMLGGVTGMRTALMLGGTSAAGFSKNVDQVAEAARKSGADVLGWAKTSDTLAVKVDKAKANLQVLAVEIGTVLIPVIDKIVAKVTKAVQWFENLSTTDKKFVGYSVVVLAALGPVLGIIGRITKAFALMWAVGAASGRFIAGVRGAEISLAGMQSTAYLTGLKVRGMSAATRGLAAALGGAAIGYGIGSLTQNASTATKTLGVLGSAAAGAALGFTVGGPLGAGIGAVAGGLTDAVKAFHLFGGAAKAQVKPTDAFTRAILADNDALGKNTTALVNNMLESKGLYEAGLKLDISQRTLLQASLGNAKAQTQVRLALEGQGAAAAHAYIANKPLTALQEAQNKAAGKLSDGLGLVNRTLAVNERAAHNEAAALGQTKTAADKTKVATDALSIALSKFARDYRVKLDTREAIASARALARAIASAGIASQTINVGQAKLAGHARGGSVADGLSVVGEAGYELLDKRGSTLRVIPHGAASAIMGGSKLPGYASGTDGAVARVLAAIRSALTVGPATVAGQRATLTQHIAGAESRGSAALIAYAGYRKLAVQLHEVTKATNAQVAASKHESVQATIAATKAQNLADKLPDTTKAQKAAKKAADAHAASLQHVAEVAGNVASKTEKAAGKRQAAAQKLADKAKASYEKMSAAAKAAAQVVQSDAQALVASIQDQFQALQQNISDFESTISGSLTSGSDLATIWGQLGSNVDDAKSALDSAQQAMQSATVDSSALAAAMSTASRASQDQAAAHAALTAALAGGNAAAILAAQRAQTDASTRLAAAQQAVSAATPTADQLTAQATAQQQLTAAQKAYNQAVAGQSAGGVASVLATFAASEQQFAGDLSKLQAAGAGQDLITQMAGMGTQAGDALAQGLINDPQALAAITASMKSIQSIADTAATTMAQRLYGSGVTSMQQLLAGIEKQYPQTAAALAPLAAKLASMFTITATVSGAVSGSAGLVDTTPGSAGTRAADTSHYYVAYDPKTGAYWDVSDTGSVHLLNAAQKTADIAAGADVVKVSGRPKPLQGFAAGVTDFAGGLAYVHAGELLVNMPRGTDVIPANQVKSGAAFDNSAVVSEIRALRAQLATLAEEIGSEQLGVIDRYGQAQAERVLLAARGKRR